MHCVIQGGQVKYYISTETSNHTANESHWLEWKRGLFCPFSVIGCSKENVYFYSSFGNVVRQKAVYSEATDQSHTRPCLSSASSTLPLIPVACPFMSVVCVFFSSQHLYHSNPILSNYFLGNFDVIKMRCCHKESYSATHIMKSVFIKSSFVPSTLCYPQSGKLS
jgi:hypothetical protein